MKLLPMNFPDLNETPLQRKLKAWRREDEYQKQERLRLWSELRAKVERLPALMDEAEHKAKGDGSLKDGYIDGRAVGELFDEIDAIRKRILIDMLI